VTPDAIAPPYVLVVVLLLVSGVMKVLRPRATAQAMLDAGLPGSTGGARCVGVVEIVVAGWAFAAPGVGGAAALAGIYLCFAAFLGYVLRTHPDAGSCGCAGATAVPPSRLHLTFDLLAAAFAIAYASTGGAALAAWIGDLGFAAIPIVAGLVVAGWLVVVAVTQVPGAWRAWAPPAGAFDHEHAPDEHVGAEDALAIAGIGPGHPSLWPGTDAGGP